MEGSSPNWSSPTSAPALTSRNAGGGRGTVSERRAWGAGVDDLGLGWQREPDQVMDASGGPEWTRWWRGGAFNHADASTEGRASRDPDGEAIAWEGEDGEVRRLTNAALRDHVVVAAR